MKHLKKYIKSVSISILCLIGVLFLGGCFQNDGYIGVYFGSWVFEKIEVDGENLPGYDGHLMISFQSSFFEMSHAGHGQVIQGIWKETGDELMLHGAEETATSFNADDEPIFPPASGMGRGDNGDLIVNLHIEKKTSKRMVWTWTAPDGKKWKYTLRHLL